MEPKLTVEVVQEYVGKEITSFAQDHFRHVPYSRRNTTAARAIRDLGFSVGRNGVIYKTRITKPDFEVLEDTKGKPYAKVSGITERGRRGGLTALFFPSRYRKEFMVSLRTWGQSGLNLEHVKPEDILISPSGIKIKVDFILVAPDRKYLPKFNSWLSSIELPYKGEKKE